MKHSWTLMALALFVMFSWTSVARTQHGKALRGHTKPVSEALFAASRGPVAAKAAVSTHAPFESKSCGVCHTATPPTKAATKRPINKVCFGCHSELKASMGKGKVHHSEVRSGCVTCHNPHNSRFKGLLIKSKTLLCKTCHNSPPKASK